MKKKIIYLISGISILGASSYYFIAHSKNEEQAIKAPLNQQEQKKAEEALKRYEKITLNDMLMNQKNHSTATAPSADDKAILDFFTRTDISRLEKARIIINEIQKIGFNSEKAQLFMDFLGTIKPIEHAREIASWLKIDMPEVSKIHLINLIKEMYRVSVDNSVPADMEALVNANKKYLVDSLHDYIYDNSQSTNLRQFALTQYGYIAETANISKVIQDIITTKIKFSGQSDRSGDLEFFLATSILQDDTINTLMPNVLQTLEQNKNNPNLTINMYDFVGRLSFYIQEKGSGKALIETFNPNLKKIVYDFLKNANMDTTYSNSNYAYYNMAIAKFEHGENWIEPYMQKYLSETNPNKIAGLTWAASDDKFWNELKKKDTSSIKFILDNEKKRLETQGAEQAESNMAIYWDYQAINDALTRINSLKDPNA
jgi:hypothetical protein